MSVATSARSGLDRAAILLLALGEQDAAQVLRHLGSQDVQRVGGAMARLSGVSREEVSGVLSSFTSSVDQQTSVGIGTDDYVRNVLTEALGAEKAGSVIESVLHGRSRGLEALKWMPPRSVAELLRAEHPQIIAIILSYLQPDQAAQVLMLLSETVRAEILMRIATLDRVHPTALHELDEVLEKQLSGSSAASAAGFGGAKVAAEILNLVGSVEEGNLITQIAKADEPLSQKLQDLMFVFGDLIEVDDRGMQELLREVPSDKLIIALKATDDKVKQKFFKNMSERAAQMLKDDLEAKGPVRLSEVEAAQKEIVVTARKMAEEGRMSLGGKGGETYV